MSNSQGSEGDFWRKKNTVIAPKGLFVNIWQITSIFYSSMPAMDTMLSMVLDWVLVRSDFVIMTYENKATILFAIS